MVLRRAKTIYIDEKSFIHARIEGYFPILGNNTPFFFFFFHEKCGLSVDLIEIINVGHRFNDKHPRVNNVSRAHRRRTLYYLDNGKLRTRKIGFFAGLYYNFTKTFLRVVVCESCKRKYKIRIKKKNLTKAYKCAKCEVKQGWQEDEDD